MSHTVFTLTNTEINIGENLRQDHTKFAEVNIEYFVFTYFVAEKSFPISQGVYQTLPSQSVHDSLVMSVLESV